MYIWRETVAVLAVVCLGTALAQSETEKCRDTLSQYTPGKQLTYHGIIWENAKDGDEVELDFPILARDKSKLEGGEVCGYTVYKSHSELPFHVVLEDPKSGCAKIVLAKGGKLDYERKSRYSFEIAPHDCITGDHADRDKVHIEVEDVNEYAPRLSKDTYLVEVEEGRIKDEILRLEAIDQDGSDDYASICHYHILTPDVPFQINGQGVLRNTEPLDYSHNHNFILEVRVEDCGGQHSRMSDKVLINIKVIPACKVGWTGISERIEYAPGVGTKLIGEQAHLETCDPTCREASVSAHIQLTTKHIGKGCDRDTYSIQSQRKLCGASSGSVDLLPSPAVSSLTKSLPTDDGAESDQIFAFDGQTNAIEIPSSKFNHTLDGHFTISTWMKHEENPELVGEKEHILCNSDGEKMNRHHYSLFVHNCRLVFLMRQEPSGQDLNTFKPAEWRWKIAQACDGQWHHYAVSVDFPQVRLYIDGKLFVDNSNNPEIIDDWPLHRTKKIHFTKLVVGACYQGGMHKLSQYFNGYLAGLVILRGKTESDRVIRCLNNCKEKLDFHAMDEMDTGMSVAFNSEMTEITINGHNGSEVEKLVHRVGYINSRLFPTPGYRSLKIQSDVSCVDGRKLAVPELNAMVMVLQPEKPIITLSGTQSMAREEHEFLHGQRILPDIRIMSQTKGEAAEDLDNKVLSDGYPDDKQNSDDDRYKLDSCIVRADQPLDLNLEHLKYPTNLIDQLGLEASFNEDGLIITGIDRLQNYEMVLRQVMYVNREPNTLNSRTFTLTCSELNGRFVSNDFTIRVDVVHVLHRAPVQQAHAQESIHVVEPKSYNVLQDVKSIAPSAGTTGNVGMVVIIVVCVGFLVFMIVLGIIRIRAAHQRASVVAVDEKAEMEWDNSALTITVNPMDQDNMFEDVGELNNLRGDDSDDSDDDVSSYHDELESSEEEAEKVKDRDLEWDDSTLTF
jgi:hypothetical protein